VQNAKNLYSTPLKLAYHADILKCLKVRDGPFLKKDGKQTALLSSINQPEGLVNINLSRLCSTGGINGDGTLAYLTFEAISQGISELSILKPEFLDADMKPYPVKAKIAEININ
jgi:general secretion pathway protein D